jgi:hypothetical protein
MKRLELRERIRYGLNGMRSRNAHHDFEALSFELARLRVASNLMLATGPVGAGGDQGRDFESYKTYLAHAFGDGVFIGRTSADVIVGACSLQGSIRNKIRQDLEKIFSSGEHPHAVYYFCEENVLAGTRHTLQTECRQKFAARLEIFDGNTIANELVEADARWIAESYLFISAEDLDIEPDNERYAALRQRWLVEKDGPGNFADFLELREGLRVSYTERSSRGDLEAWLAAMRPLTELEDEGVIRQRARYEYVVAALRGGVAGADVLPMWRAYFDGLSFDSPVKLISDAAPLFSFAYASAESGQVDISQDDFRALNTRIQVLLDERMEKAESNEERVALLEANLQLGLFASHLAGEDQQAMKRRALSVLEALVEQAKTTPFFPVTRLGKFFEIYGSAFGGDANFRAMNAQVERIVSERDAASDVAGKARTRAIEYYKSGELLAAIDEFHRARVGWFSHDTIDGSIMAMLLLSDAYLGLGLVYAARYYAAGALFMASLYPDDSIKRHVSRAAFALATTYLAAGEGLAYLISIGQALELHSATAAKAEAWNEHEHVKTCVVNAMIYRTMTRRLAPKLLSAVDDLIRKFPLPKDEVAALMAMSEGPPWSDMSATALENVIRQDIGASPFSEAYHVLRWNALGILWTLTYESGTEHAAALELATTLQIVQADLAMLDLMIIPSDVCIHVSLGNVATPVIRPVSSNDESSWYVIMPATPPSGEIDVTAYAVAIALEILKGVSALPLGDLERIVRDRFQGGLADRTLSVRPARELANFTPLDVELREKLSDADLPAFDPPIVPSESREMVWKTGPGLNYTPERAKDALQRRYENFLRSVKLTLPKLLADERCRAIIGELRQEGLLDWQILSIISSIVISFQDEAQYGKPRGAADLKEIDARRRARAQREERPDDPKYELADFTANNVREYKAFHTVVVMQGWGLENRRRTPDLLAIKKLLDERYANAKDDIEHDDPFAATGVPEIQDRRILSSRLLG